MTLEEKKTHILRLIPLGVDFFSACIDARCTEAEIEQLENDEEMQVEIEYATNAEKVRLIENYLTTVKAAAFKKLDYNGLRTFLKDFHPDAFESDDNGNTQIKSIAIKGVAP